MTLKQLEVFLAVAHTLSFSKGGESVRLAQSTASQHIRALEDELGARLFDRYATQVSLTEVGRLFYEHAAKICKLCIEGQDAVKHFQGLEQATLRVGASTIPAACLIPDLLGGFTATWPGVRLELQQGDTREAIRLLQDDLVELAVVGGKSENNTVCFQKVRNERIILIAPSKQEPEPIRCLQHLEGVPLIVREPGSGTRQATDAALQKAGLDPRALRVVAQVGSSEAVRRAVLGGAGCAFISTSAVERELAEGSLKQVAVEGLEISRSLYLAWRKGRSLSPAAEAFAEMIRNLD